VSAAIDAAFGEHVAIGGRVRATVDRCHAATDRCAHPAAHGTPDTATDGGPDTTAIRRGGRVRRGCRSERRPLNDGGTAGGPVIRLSGVSVRRAGRTILGPVDWSVGAGERWVVIGPNGSGKTTLAQVVSTNLWPTTGTVEVLGATIGRVDARELRHRIGYASAIQEAAFDPALTARDVVMTARYGALAPWWHAFDDRDRSRADALLDDLGVAALSARPVGLLSTGERRRVQIARALMPDPDLLILDEPAAGLDLGARETLVRDLGRLAASDRPAAILLVTHHVEEIPGGFGHALVLGAGQVAAAGRIDDILSGPAPAVAFGVPLRIGREAGRFRAWLDPNEGDRPDEPTSERHAPDEY
jgi:iron complex transport system ATP-binding protein